MELINIGYETENLTELEKELKRFFVPIVVSMFREIIEEVTFDEEKKEIFIKSKRFTFKITSSAKIKNLKGSFSSIEKENVKICCKEFKEIISNF